MDKKDKERGVSPKTTTVRRRTPTKSGTSATEELRKVKTPIIKTQVFRKQRPTEGTSDVEITKTIQKWALTSPQSELKTCETLKKQPGQAITSAGRIRILSRPQSTGGPNNVPVAIRELKKSDISPKKEARQATISEGTIRILRRQQPTERSSIAQSAREDELSSKVREVPLKQEAVQATTSTGTIRILGRPKSTAVPCNVQVAKRQLTKREISPRKKEVSPRKEVGRVGRVLGIQQPAERPSNIQAAGRQSILREICLKKREVSPKKWEFPAKKAAGTAASTGTLGVLGRQSATERVSNVRDTKKEPKKGEAFSKKREIVPKKGVAVPSAGTIRILGREQPIEGPRNVQIVNKQTRKIDTSPKKTFKKNGTSPRKEAEPVKTSPGRIKILRRPQPTEGPSSAQIAKSQTKKSEASSKKLPKRSDTSPKRQLKKKGTTPKAELNNGETSKEELEEVTTFPDRRPMFSMQEPSDDDEDEITNSETFLDEEAEHSATYIGEGGVFWKEQRPESFSDAEITTPQPSRHKIRIPNLGLETIYESPRTIGSNEYTMGPCRIVRAIGCNSFVEWRIAAKNRLRRMKTKQLQSRMSEHPEIPVEVFMATLKMLDE